MPLSNHVTVNVSIASAALTLPGFGRPLVLASPGAEPVAFTERLRIYNEAADMLTDGWLTSDEEYLMALAIFSQRPRPVDIMVGRRDTAVAQVNTITVLTGSHTGTFTITLNGSSVVFVASADDAAVVAAGLDTALAAHPDVIAGIVVPTYTPSNEFLTLTAALAGIPMVISVTGPTTGDLLSVVTVASRGIPEDLADVSDENDDWYLLLIPEQDRQTVRFAVAPTIEAQNRLFGAQLSEAAIVDGGAFDPGDITADIASELKGLSFRRSIPVYSANSINFTAAAMAGLLLPTEPGSSTWKFKSPSGVAAEGLTATQRSNLLSKDANTLETVAGRVIFIEGTVAQGEFIDIMRGVDKLTQRIQELVFGAQVSQKKIPYTQRGLDFLGGLVASALQEQVPDFIAESREINGVIEAPGYTVTVPRIGTIDAGTRESRVVPLSNPIKFEATLTGAIHIVNITGTVSF